MAEIANNSIIDKAKNLFYNRLSKHEDLYNLLSHLPEMEKWANFMIKKHPEADSEVILLGVWLHDIGHYPLPSKKDNPDHAVRGEKIAQEFLEKEKYPIEKMERVLHCIRSHRNRDVAPKIIEAKIIACIDSASHMTDDVYFRMAHRDKEINTNYRPLDKLERDYRDISVFPEVKKELKEMYQSWKKLLEVYEKFNFK
jgi:HD superfamily phosphodiesterase